MTQLTVSFSTDFIFSLFHRFPATPRIIQAFLDWLSHMQLATFSLV